MRTIFLLVGVLFFNFQSGIGASETAPPAVPTGPSVTLDVGDNAFLVEHGSAQRPALVISNPSDKAVEVPLRVQVEDFAGVIGTYEAKVSVPATGKTSWLLPESAWKGSLGIKWVTWTLADVPAPRRASFVHLVSTGRKPAGYRGFEFSINGAIGALESPIAARIGATAGRGGTHWALAQPKRDGPIDFNVEGFDTAVDAAVANGIEPQVIISYNTLWNAPEAAKLVHQPLDPKGSREWDLIFTYPVDLEAYRKFVRAWAVHFKGRVHWAEPWNEPAWFGDVIGHPEWYPNDTYLKMQRIVWEELKAVDPSYLVMTGGFAMFNDKAGLQDLVIKDAQDWYEVHTVHGHGDMHHLRREMALINAARARYRATDKPIYSNETAWYYSDPTIVRERFVAEQMVRMVTYLMSEGVVGHAWFLFRDVPGHWDFSEQYERWGMWDDRVQPKAVVAAYNTMTGLLRGKESLETLPLGAGHYAYRFGNDLTRPGEQVIVSWREGDDVGDAVYTITVDPGTTAETVDLVGNATALSVVDGRLPVQIGIRPRWLRLRNCTFAPQVVGTLIEASGDLRVPAGASGTIAARVRNPLLRPITVETAWSVAGNPATSGPVQTLAVGATVRAEGVITLPANARRSGQAGSARMDWALPAAGWSGSLALPLSVIQNLPAGGFERAPDFVLDSIEDTENRFTVILGAEKLRWNGPQDVSARCWIGREGDQLHLRFAVRDDVHAQPFRGAGQWQADGVQLVLALPGQSGFWELGLARLNDGTAEVTQWVAPTGRAAIRDACHLVVTDIAGGLQYDVSLPRAGLGLDEALLQSGFRFSFLVNDFDDKNSKEQMREGWIRLSAGIADSKDPGKYPWLRFGKP